MSNDVQKPAKAHEAIYEAISLLQFVLDDRKAFTFISYRDRADEAMAVLEKAVQRDGVAKPAKAHDGLEQWIDDASIAVVKDMIEDCPGEVLRMAAALVNLDITTRDHAGDLEADGFVFRAEEAINRAEKYRETLNSICQIWNDDSDRVALAGKQQDEFWTITNIDSGDPVVPNDCNPKSDDEGMLVYRSKESATHACEYQKELYDINAVAIRLSSLGIRVAKTEKEQDGK